MAHFTRVRNTGMWTVSAITPTEIEKIDANLFAAVNGDAGGSWTPSAAINIGGTHGLAIAAGTPFTADGITTGASLLTLPFATTIGTNNTQTCTINSLLHVAQQADFAAGAIFSSTTQFQGTATFLGNVQLGNTSSDTLQVDATATFARDVTINRGLSIGSNFGITFGSNGYIGQYGMDVTLHGTIRLATGASAGTSIIKRILRATASVSPDPGEYDVVQQYTAGTNVTLPSSGYDGTTIRVCNYSGGNVLVKDYYSSATLITLTTLTWVDMVRDAAAGHGWSSIGQGTLTAL